MAHSNQGQRVSNSMNSNDRGKDHKIEKLQHTLDQLTQSYNNQDRVLRNMNQTLNNMYQTMSNMNKKILALEQASQAKPQNQKWVYIQ